ncbi:MAG TPA: flagellar basal body-associated FliL family protein [Thauera sp.]|jgi:flagellar FliL protein|nr:flagellar basal body-associated FliL family protein [Thauera sp.]HRA82016.1 flagellar basal body-associated FliL family protein [Thauera sp.]
MSKAPPKPESAEDGAAPKKKSKLMMIIVIVLLVVLIVVAGAVGALLLLKKDKGHEEADAHDAAAAPAAPTAVVVDLSKPPTFVPLDPFTVNLRGDEGDHYLQVAIVLRVSDAKLGESLKGFMPEIRHRINLMLSSKLPSELASTEGREILAATIVDETNAALGFPVQTDARGRSTSIGPIQAVLFNSFIIQ